MAGRFALAEEDLDRYAGIPEAAVRLGIGRTTAYDLIARGEFPVPVHVIAGKNVVSLRRLVEAINGEAS